MGKQDRLGRLPRHCTLKARTGGRRIEPFGQTRCQMVMQAAHTREMKCIGDTDVGNGEAIGTQPLTVR